jgi:cytochrome b
MTTIDSETRGASARTQTDVRRKVWDAPVRLFHWALVAAFLGAFVTNRLGVSFFKYHLWCGYAVIVLVAFRVVWGVVGTRHALFRNFVKGPRAVLAYARDLLAGRDARHAGHNPLGALMVLTLLATLAAQAVAGLFSNDEIFNAGPLAALVAKDASLRLTGLHKTLFYWIAAAAALHVVAVVAHVIGKRDNLLRAMITGDKPAHHVRHSDAIHSSRLLLAVVIFSGLSVALATALEFAPVGAGDFGAE